MEYMCNKHLFLFNLDNFTPDRLFYTDVVHSVRDKYQICVKILEPTSVCVCIGHIRKAYDEG